MTIFFFSPYYNSLDAVNSTTLNGPELREPYVLLLSFLPRGPFGMKDSQEMDSILSSLQASGAEQDSSKTYSLIIQYL